jgi:hypothetical protein
MKFRRTTDAMPLVQEHFPALQHAPARMAPKAAPIQEIAAVITNRLGPI